MSLKSYSFQFERNKELNFVVFPSPKAAETFGAAPGAHFCQIHCIEFRAGIFVVGETHLSRYNGGIPLNSQ